MIASPHERLPRQGLLLLAALSLCWGANWPIMKMVLSEMPPLYFRSTCLLLGGIGMLALARVTGMSLKVPRGQWGRVLWLAAFNISGWNALVIIGVSLLPSGRAALLGYTMPLWSVLLSAIFLGDKLSLRAVLGLLLGVSGIGVLVGGSFGGMLQAPLGVVCMILGAWSWAIGVVLFKRLPVAMPTSSLTGWTMLIGSLPLLVLAVPLETSRLAVPSTGPILGMLYNIFIAFMFCYWAWNRIVLMVPVAVSSLSSLTTPLIGVLGGVVFLGEPLGWREVMASLLIVGAVGSVSIKR
ncbi:DMT family transporter [Propionivibrio soli]|uniref:DMT family transporter n=1 Tax=Propionivibrio soli TaxID=2976531 RepID=UPI0021E83518|nr:EamA family transporter [Propionivibrio soli]